MDNYDKINSLGLLISDAQCYRAICMKLIEASTNNNKPALLGDANGCSSFMSLLFNQDISTLVFEGTKLLIEQGEKENNLFSDSMDGYYERLKSVRNSMHLYNKSGSYRPKATAIVDSQLEKFQMVERDCFFDLRNDIALIFEISNTGKKLLGTNYNVFHIMENDFGWEGKEIRQYAQDTAAFLNTFSCLDMFVLPAPDDKVLKCEPMQIEFFDHKSGELFEQISMERATTFRLLLLLSAISYTECLFEMHIDFDVALKSDIWLCFLNKLVAIKYDEVFDSLNNLLEHANESDKKVLLFWFESEHISVRNLKYREVARNLRNMIHYASNSFRFHLDKSGKPEINVCKIYAQRSGLATWEALKENLSGMLKELAVVGNILRDIFQKAGDTQ